MKYGVVIYKNTDNLGDDIQSYAQIKHLPHVDYYVEREMLDTFSCDDEAVALIMSGWYLKNKQNWPPSEKILPLFVSTHFSQNDPLCIEYDFLEGPGGDYLRAFGPIGTRDLSTLDALKERNIPAYLTGCLTLTIELPSKPVERKGVVLCDIDKRLAEEIIKTYPDTAFSSVTHLLDPAEHSASSFEERFSLVEHVLEKYQSSKLVITTRLHCALPCLALGTPVLLVNNGAGLDRLGFYLNFLHHCSSDELLKKLDEESWISHPRANSEKYLELKKGLESRCHEFVQKVVDEPAPQVHTVTVDELSTWQKDLINRSEIRRSIRDRKNALAAEWSEQQIEQLTANYDMLHEWTDKLQDTKYYLENRLAELEDWASKEDEAKHEIERLGKLELEKRTGELNIIIAQNSKVINDIKQSLSWKIGRAVTKVPREIRNRVRKANDRTRS